MSDPTLKQAIAEAYASAPSDVIIFETIEIRHSALTVPARCVRDHQVLNARLELAAPIDPGLYVDFQPLAFRLELPSVTPNGVTEIKVALDAVDFELVKSLRAASESGEPIELTYRLYLSNDLTGPQNDPPMHFTLTAPVVSDYSIEATANLPSLVNLAFPTTDYTLTQFPGLVDA
jgi:Domain of unknown function (DUF1833)